MNTDRLKKVLFSGSVWIYQRDWTVYIYILLYSMLYFGGHIPLHTSRPEKMALDISDEFMRVT